MLKTGEARIKQAALRLAHAAQSTAIDVTVNRQDVEILLTACLTHRRGKNPRFDVKPIKVQA